MPLSNSEAIKNLTDQKQEIESQIENLRINYLKIIGAIDALTQIEKSNEEEEASPEVSEEETE